jgi:hypothetical protein
VPARCLNRGWVDTGRDNIIPTEKPEVDGSTPSLTTTNVTCTPKMSGGRSSQVGVKDLDGPRHPRGPSAYPDRVPTMPGF